MTSANQSCGASVLASRPAPLDRGTSSNLLANIRVASPCSARWADMTGNERARFCAQCQKHVSNLSEMTAEAAAELIRNTEGKLCVRFYRRADGAVLTADCSVGVGAFVRRVKRLMLVGVGVLVPAFAAPLWYQSPSPKSPTRSKVHQTWDTAVLTISNWFNPSPTPPPAVPAVPGRFIMGECVAPPPKSVPFPPASAPANSK